MLTIARDTVAAIHYIVSTSADGKEVDRSDDGMPLVYLHGHSNIIPGLEAALAGKQQGDKLRVNVPAAQAYGVRDDALDFMVGEDAFPEEVRGELKPGFRFRASHPAQPDRDVVYTVLGREGADIAVTGNHELAGRDLDFQVEVAWVRPATDEEKQHGHIHSHCCGGHSHACADGEGDGHAHAHGEGCGHGHEHGDGGCGKHQRS